MEHLFLLRSQAHELKMPQMVEEISLGRHTTKSAMAKYEVLTRKTVSQWLERVRQEELARTPAMKQTDPNPAPTPVERVAQTADTLAGRSSCSNKNSNTPNGRCSVTRRLSGWPSRTGA